jgi:hypothetical protein
MGCLRAWEVLGVLRRHFTRRVFLFQPAIRTQDALTRFSVAHVGNCMRLAVFQGNGIAGRKRIAVVPLLKHSIRRLAVRGPAWWVPWLLWT